MINLFVVSVLFCIAILGLCKRIIKLETQIKYNVKKLSIFNKIYDKIKGENLTLDGELRDLKLDLKNTKEACNFLIGQNKFTYIPRILKQKNSTNQK